MGPPSSGTGLRQTLYAGGAVFFLSFPCRIKKWDVYYINACEMPVLTREIQGRKGRFAGLKWSFQ
jgi:hypothetical protein